MAVELGARCELAFELTYSDVRPRVAVFASKAPHCLYDLLLAHQLGELGGDLVAVVSNHDDLRPVAGHFGVRFEHVPVDAAGNARRTHGKRNELGQRCGVVTAEGEPSQDAVSAQGELICR